MVPFHLLPGNVVAAAHHSLGKLVGNHRKMMDEFDWDQPSSCPCQAFKKQEDSQHVPTSLCALDFSHRVKYITGVSAKTQMYKWRLNMTTTLTLTCFIRASQEEEEFCGSTHHLLQQLHLRQVVSSGKHCVEHLASCIVSWQFWAASSTREIFQDLRAFLSNAPLDVHLEQRSRDHLGFFTSVPIKQAMDYVRHLVQQYAAKQAGDLSDVIFTVQLTATEPKLRVFQRRFKRHRTRT